MVFPFPGSGSGSGSFGLGFDDVVEADDRDEPLELVEEELSFDDDDVCSFGGLVFFSDDFEEGFFFSSAASFFGLLDLDAVDFFSVGTSVGDSDSHGSGKLFG